MRTADEIRAHYKSELLPQLKDLDGRRKKILVGLIAADLVGAAMMALPLIISISAAMFFPEQSTALCCVGIIPAFLGIIVIGGAYHLMTKSYVSDFKRDVMGKIVKFMDEGLEYNPSSSVPMSTYHDSNIFQSHVDRSHGEDYVSGIVGKTKIEFSELHTEYKTQHTDSEGHRHTSWNTIFRGVFFVADFNKEFKGRTLVLPDTAEKTFGTAIGQFLQSKSIGRPDLVKLEDPEFEKLFVVYGNDQIEARYILSTSLMSRMVDFRKKTGKKISFSFTGSKVMVAIPFRENLFEPRILRSIVDPKQIEKYAETLATVVGIVEDLNLNTRIWSKK